MTRDSANRTADSRRPDRDRRPQARLRPAFQPIVDLQSGAVVGFEALARFEVGQSVIAPVDVLPRLKQDDLLSLFCRMVEHSLDLVQKPWWPAEASYVSVNVEAGLIMSEGFCELLEHLIDKAGGDPRRIVVEMLEGERVDDHTHMARVLTRLRDMGISVALDDVGSGYSSLIAMRNLPVDIVKLDRSFSIELQEKPNDLVFILMLANLARSLGKRLVIEGVETAEALDALTILGIGLAQGYAIARPMAADAIAGWLAARETIGAHRTPTSLLGAYASHLTVVETCRMLQLQPLEMEWKDQARDWRSCRIGRFFTQADLHHTRCGHAHRRFHDVIARYETDRPVWEAAASEFQAELVEAMISEMPSSSSAETSVRMPDAARSRQA